MNENTVELRIPSKNGYEKLAMNLAADVARMMGFTHTRIDDLKTAVSEACINAMEHGNQYQQDTKVTIILTVNAEQLAIDVTDEGLNSKPISPQITAPNIEAQILGIEEPGNMGLFLINALVD